jgi:hypothetical protein
MLTLTSKIYIYFRGAPKLFKDSGTPFTFDVFFTKRGERRGSMCDAWAFTDRVEGLDEDDFAIRATNRAGQRYLRAQSL